MSQRTLCACLLCALVAHLSLGVYLHSVDYESVYDADWLQRTHHIVSSNVLVAFAAFCALTLCLEKKPVPTTLPPPSVHHGTTI